MNMNTVFNWPVWPSYREDHENAVLRVIKSNQLFAAKEVTAFEREYADFVGSTHAVGVGNATQGLHLALAALGVGTGDEVIVTPYSWISSASCVLMQNAIPVFVDIESESFGISPARLVSAISERTRVVILVHMFGLASQVEEIKLICEERGIFLIEDGSHAHGVRLKNVHLGTLGDIGVFSLHQRKAISTGDGGIICTDNSELFEKMRRLRSFGADQLSFNYRMTEFAAALGRVGLKGLDLDNEKRRDNHRILLDNLDNTLIRVIKPRLGVEAVFYSNLLDINISADRQINLIALAHQSGIPLKRTWQPLHKHPHFLRKNMPNNIAPWDCLKGDFEEPANKWLPIAEEFQTKRLFELDCHPLVPPEVVAQAANVLRNAIENEI
jgi:dTDP-4-amino-4,6-dideoxygalactose transaminase